jgi:hypothetical protein
MDLAAEFAAPLHVKPSHAGQKPAPAPLLDAVSAGRIDIATGTVTDIPPPAGPKSPEGR